MDVLVYLAEHAGEVVVREDLVQAVCGRQAVTDDAINRSISKLRTYVGDDSRSPRYVETVPPKRGYRLIANVDSLVTHAERRGESARSDEQVPQAAERRSTRRKSLWFQLVAGTLAGVAGAVVVVDQTRHSRTCQMLNMGQFIRRSANYIRPNGCHKSFGVSVFMR